MICEKCGVENSPENRFCRECGAELPHGITEKKTNHTALKIIAACVVAILLIIGITIFTIVSMEHKKEKIVQEKIDSGNRFLKEMDYEQAEEMYLAAIEIDPRQETPYVELAELYFIRQEPAMAQDIIELAYENVPDKNQSGKLEEIQAKYSLYTYVDDVLAPEIDRVKAGAYEYGYEYIPNTEVVRPLGIHDQKGVMNYRIMDFDNDKDEELLVVVLEPYTQEITYSGEPEEILSNRMVLQMYENNDGEIEKAAEFQLKGDILNSGDKYDSGVFLKESGGKMYICAGTYSLVYINADGSSFETYILTYDGDFQSYTDTGENLINGSSFYEQKEEADDMAGKLEAIGLTKSPSEMRQNLMMRLYYTDETLDDLLVHMVGDNDGTFRRNIEIGNYKPSPEMAGNLLAEIRLPDEKETEKQCKH